MMQQLVYKKLAKKVKMIYLYKIKSSSQNSKIIINLSKSMGKAKIVLKVRIIE